MASWVCAPASGNPRPAFPPDERIRRRDASRSASPVSARARAACSTLRMLAGPRNVSAVLNFSALSYKAAGAWSIRRKCNDEAPAVLSCASPSALSSSPFSARRLSPRASGTSARHRSGNASSARWPAIDLQPRDSMEFSPSAERRKKIAPLAALRGLKSAARTNGGHAATGRGFWSRGRRLFPVAKNF